MAEAGPIPFTEAIDFFAGKVNLPTKRYDDLQRGAHVRAFSVAGMMRDDWLTEIRTALAKAQVEGTGLKAFQDTFDDLVKRTGWKFNARGDTEAQRRAWRARLIYKTNMRVSYMAGRWKQLTEPAVAKYRPYLMYKHSGALHPRHMHLAWNGKIWLVTDPIWKIIFPPNGFGCGCDVVALNLRQLKALGKTGPDPTPDLQPYTSKDPRTGQIETRYAGIDRGWDYNPGEEWLNGIVPKELAAPLKMPIIGPQLPQQALPRMATPSAVLPAQILPEGLAEQDYADRFLAEFGIPPQGAKEFRDRSGGLVTISEALFHQRDQQGNVIALKADKNKRGRYMLLLADAIREPDEIWVDWAEMASGLALRRSYLKRYVLPDQRSMFLRFEWTKAGWSAITAFDSTFNYVEKYRQGALLYMRN